MNDGMSSVFLGALSLIAIITCFRASIQSPVQLSPQGCRMSFMSPSYILQSGFNASWSNLNGRYSLWLYREVGWENNQVCDLHVSNECMIYELNHTEAIRDTCAFHSRKRRLISPSALDCLLRYKTVFFFPICRIPGFFLSLSRR